MDNRSMTWLPELEIEELCHIMKQHQQTHPYYSDSLDSFFSGSLKVCPNLVTINQSNQVATINRDVDKQQDYMSTKSSPLAPSYGSFSNNFTISFGNPTSPQEMNRYELYGGSKLKDTDIVTPKEETSLTEFIRYMDDTRKVRSTRRNHRQAQEHVVAERKRREKLAERFVSLSALLPGLTKMDKATVLDDASKYILQLQTRIKELEETSVKGKDIIHESALSMGKASSDATNYLPNSSTFNPNIKARISGSQVLVKIYCKKSSLLALKTITEIEKLHMTIICCNILPFDTSHIITITAQMSDKMVITRIYLVKCLHSALRGFL